MTDWDLFHKNLKGKLAGLPAPKKLESDAEFTAAVSSLTQAIQGAIQEVVPVSKTALHSCRWRSLELTHLKKVKNKFNNLSYLHCTVHDHPCHTKYKAVSNKYRNSIRVAKTQH